MTSPEPRPDRPGLSRVHSVAVVGVVVSARGLVLAARRCDDGRWEPPVTAGPREETSAVEWVTPEEAVRRMPPVFAARVTDALSTGAPASRAHDGHDLV